MGNPFVGEIRLFAGLYAPLNWNFCDGSIFSIAQNELLFQLIGTTYGGDGVQTFALPDLRSRVPMHQGGGNMLGQAAGSENVTLLTAQLPAHSHTFNATSTGQTLSPKGNLPAVATSTHAGAMNIYGPPGSNPASLNPASVQPDGGNLPHNNVQPYLAVGFIIALYGIFPPHP